MNTDCEMNNDEITQLMHEGYHSVETIAKWTNVPVHYVEEMYQAYLIERNENV